MQQLQEEEEEEVNNRVNRIALHTLLYTEFKKISFILHSIENIFVPFY
jgi:hypothetical protein